MRTSRPARRCKWRAFLGYGALLALLLVVLAWASPAQALTLPVGGYQSQPTVAASLFETAAVKADGSLWIWGEAILSHDTGLLVPTSVGADTDWTAVSADGIVVALKSDGSLWAVDYPAGDGSDEAISGGSIAAVRLGTGNDWTHVSGGVVVALALKSDGSLWALETDWDTKLPVSTRLGVDTDWATVSDAGAYSFAIKNDGSLWTVLREEEYVDEDDFENYETIVSWVVARIGADADWATVSGGANSAVAIRTDGSLWTITHHRDYELDPVSGDLEYRDWHTVERVGTDGDWVTAATSGDHWLAVKADGTLWTWGQNSSGELGDGTTDDKDEPVRLGSSNKWRAVVAGSRYSLALKADGTLWAWGDNLAGQLGDGSFGTERHEPVQVLDGVSVPAWPGDQGAPATFPDVAGSPYEAAIRDLAGRGVVGGFEDGTFRPDMPVSRQQFAKMIVKALALPVTGSEVCPFTDVAAQMGADPLYPSKYVSVCAVHGITQGKTATTFSPESDITREQLITMAVRAAAPPDPPTDYVPSFSSAQFSLEQHCRNARKAEYAGLLDGLQGLGRSYDLGASSNRGECAQILFNLLKITES